MAKYAKKPCYYGIEAEQWFPGKHVEGVTEVVHDPGDGSTGSNGYGMCNDERVEPGDYIVTVLGGHECYAKDVFERLFELVN